LFSVFENSLPNTFLTEKKKKKKKPITFYFFILDSSQNQKLKTICQTGSNYNNKRYFAVLENMFPKQQTNSQIGSIRPPN